MIAFHLNAYEMVTSLQLSFPFAKLIQIVEIHQVHC